MENLRFEPFPSPPGRADSRTCKIVAADGSRRTFPQLLRSAPTAVGGYDFLKPPSPRGLSLSIDLRFTEHHALLGLLITKAILTLNIYENQTTGRLRRAVTLHGEPSGACR